MSVRYLMPVLFVTVLNSCDPPYPVGTFPETPVNAEDINSEFDDYNSTSPTIGETAPLCLSSNRKSDGKEFDIVYQLLDVIMSKSNGIITVEEHLTTTSNVYDANVNLTGALSVANNGYDDLGPYSIPQGNKSKSGLVLNPFTTTFCYLPLTLGEFAYNLHDNLIMTLLRRRNVFSSTPTSYQHHSDLTITRRLRGNCFSVLQKKEWYA